MEGWPQVEVQLHLISRRLFSGLDTCTSTTHQKKHQDLKTRTLEYRQPVSHSDFRTTLKNNFGKCSLCVLSANR